MRANAAVSATVAASRASRSLLLLRAHAREEERDREARPLVSVRVCVRRDMCMCDGVSTCLPLREPLSWEHGESPRCWAHATRLSCAGSERAGGGRSAQGRLLQADAAAHRAYFSPTPKGIIASNCGTCSLFGLALWRYYHEI